MKTPQQIVEEFFASGCVHMPNIPGNRIFFTDSTASLIAWVEQNVVIEYYMLLPSVDVPMHYHPFSNQVIFLEGDLTASRELENGQVVSKTFTDKDHGYIGTVMPPGLKHSFITGPRGCALYNIQIWDADVQDALSAAIEYLGPSMGPIHEQAMAQLKLMP